MPADSLIYWDSMDFDSEDNSDSHSNYREESIRRYVDPWDLENYAYIRKHVASTPEPDSTPSPTGEPTDSTFYYVPGRYATPADYFDTYTATGNHVLYGGMNARYAGIDEAHFMNERILFENGRPGDPHMLPPFNDMDTSSDGDGDEETETERGTQMNERPLLYVYETNRRRRSMAVPTLQRMPAVAANRRRHSMAAAMPPPPAPPRPQSPSSRHIHTARYASQDDRASAQLQYEMNSRSSIYGSTDGKLCHRHIHSGYATKQIYADLPGENHYRLEHNVYGKPYSDLYEREMPIPIYDETSLLRSKPDNFGLSTYGHLKIDYSFSWHSLDRFIGK